MTGELSLNVTAVALGERGLMIEGPPGSGKSSLALALIDRGAMLIGDDGVMLERRDGRIWLSPPERHRGRLEVRGVGLIDLPTSAALLDVILKLDPDAPRAPAPEKVDVLGCQVTQLPFRAGDAIQALRAEHALRQFRIGGEK